MANYHVTPNKDGTWNARRAGANKASSIHSTQREAELQAKTYSGNSGGGEVRIHGRDGAIRDSDTVKPGNDPYPPRDRKH